ncbi:MAG TPA: ATP-binding protein [Terriglobales bacterium]
MPTSANGDEVCGAASALGLANAAIGTRRDEDQESLLHAFRTFADVARSLESSYTKLRNDVVRLERELAASNGELARRAEENERMRVHLDRILETLPCGVLLTSGGGRILRANPEAFRILDRHNEGAEPTSVAQLSVSVQELLAASRQTNHETELRVAFATEGVRWLAARYAALREGNDDTAIYILRDVSERKRLDEIEARCRRDQELASVATLLAHEIRNPLGSLELFAGLLMDSALASEQRQWVDHVQAGVRMLSATVNNVLHFHSAPALQRAPLDIGQLLRWTTDFVAPLARQSGTIVSLQNSLSGVVLAADRHRLQQVLLNLILNSFHAMPEGGWVELRGRVSPDGNAAVVEVADAGPGIPADQQDVIFEPGFTDRSGSPGLGLTVCRNIVTQHGGEIRARNRNGGGAIFTVTLPRTTAGVRP